jgi:hypothetical protein
MIGLLSIQENEPMTYLLHALAAATLLAGCTATSSTPTTPATPTQDKPMNSSATLLPQRTVDVGPGATLRYDGAADSRCPPDVRCITAGELSYKFTLSGAAGTETFGLSKEKPAFDASTFKGVRVSLGNTAEPPLRASTAAAPVVMMPVTVNITRP